MPKKFKTVNNLPYVAYQRPKEDSRFYLSKPWRQLRQMVLREQPLCMDCKIKQATEVHHIKERKAFPDLALVRENLVGLCHSCHLSRRNKPEG